MIIAKIISTTRFATRTKKTELQKNLMNIFVQCYMKNFSSEKSKRKFEHELLNIFVQVEGYSKMSKEKMNEQVDFLTKMRKSLNNLFGRFFF